MFLPLVTNRRSPTTLAPVVRPASCLMDPRDSTLSGETQSGPLRSASATGAATRASARTAAASARRMPPTTQRRLEACDEPPDRLRAGQRLPLGVELLDAAPGRGVLLGRVGRALRRAP